MEEEASTPNVAGQTPWPVGLRALEAQREMVEEEAREREAAQPSLEQQQQPQPEEQLLHQQDEQQQQLGGQENKPLESPPRILAGSVPQASQEPGDQEGDLPVYGPPTPAWLLPGAPAAIRAESGRADGVVALACMMRTPTDPESEIKGTLYGMDGIAPGFLRERRAWEDRFPSEEDEIGSSGSKDGTWKTVDDDGRFPCLADLFLRHGGSLETVENFLRGVKVRADREMENWCPDRIRIRASSDPSEPNIFLDDKKEVEKWEHVEELRLWMNHVVGLLSDVSNNGLGPACFVSVSRAPILVVLLGFYVLIPLTPDSQDMKETSRIKSSFIHATRGGWEQLPLLKDQLLESQEKLLKAYKDLIALEEEKKVREAALAEAREASKKAEEEAVRLRERTLTVEEAASRAREEVLSHKNVIADLDKEKGLLQTDLDSLRDTFQKMKVACVENEVARGAAEDAKKKALEDLEIERARSRSLSDDVERLKGELLEKSGAVAQAGKVIEDLRVANTELARSNKEIERANTRLVGENTALEESIKGMFPLSNFLFEVCLSFS